METCRACGNNPPMFDFGFVDVKVRMEHVCIRLAYGFVVDTYDRRMWFHFDRDLDPTVAWQGVVGCDPSSDDPLA